MVFGSGVRSGMTSSRPLALSATAVGIGRLRLRRGARRQDGRHRVRCCRACWPRRTLTMGLNGYASIAELSRDVLVRT